MALTEEMKARLKSKGLKVAEKPKSQKITTKQKYIIREVANCPLKINSFHICTQDCKATYGLKPFIINPVIEQRIDYLLKKYPLNDDWVQVADPDKNAFYFWNQKGNLVSWIPPACPKANIEAKQF
ncbi:MAG: Polyglutamine-binding protein 1 [Marteilia pararefringens]